MTPFLTALTKGDLAFGSIAVSPFLVFWVLDTGYFAYTNATNQNTRGYTEEELKHLRVSDVLADYDSEERKSLRAEIDKSRGGLARAVLVRKDGSTFPVESNNVLLEFNGKSINCAICRDITLEVSRAGAARREILSLNTTITNMRQLYVVADNLNIIGSSKQLQRVLKKARRFALRGTLPILITGETGVGKESLARFVHANGPRAEAPFVVVNCADFAENDLISKLFGHVRGAFTGAVKDRKGTFASATGGTLFLDEIGELSPGAQQKLLRVIQNGTYYRMGEDRERSCDVSIVAATNANLPAMIRAGTFREDLFYRIGTLQLRLPPLRERRSDISQLVDFKLALIHARGGESLTRPDKAGMQLLLAYGYPGNIRQLFNH